MIQVQFDQAKFARDIGRLAQVTRRELKDVLREQAGFLCADALRLTPPTGNAPTQEGFGAQRRQGLAATERDIRRVFFPIRRLKFETTETKFGEAINKLMRKGRYFQVEALLRRIGFGHFIDVIPEADRQLHEKLRDRRGRVLRSKPAYFVDRTATINRYIRTRIAKVGFAKSGWMKALRAVGRAQEKGRTRVPGWISDHRGVGLYFERGSGDKVELQAGNSVPYIQHMAGKILGRAWQERQAKLPMQIRQIERKMQRQLQQAA